MEFVLSEPSHCHSQPFAPTILRITNQWHLMAGRTTLQCLGRMARLALTEQEQGASQLLTKRFFYPERFSPRQFAKDKPIDPSALWVSCRYIVCDDVLGC